MTEKKMNKEADSSPLVSLKDALEGAQRNSSQMLSRLRRFESRLEVIDQKMIPIAQTTQKYSRAKENITLTLIEVEKTYEYFRITSDAKEIISLGWSSTTKRQFLEVVYAFLLKRNTA